MSEPTNLRRDGLFLLGMAFLSLAVWCIYWSAVRAPFIFDDTFAIIDNPSIRHLWPLVGGGTDGAPLTPAPGTPVSARPLVSLSLAVNYHFGQLDPFGYRVAHIVLHILTALLLWGIVYQTLRLDHFQGKFAHVAGPLSYTAALVWALHPVNSETIVYVTQRTELMMGFFYLATVYLSIRYWGTARIAARATWLALTTLACLCGMICKEVMVSAPVMVLLYERTFIAGSFRAALRRSWPLYLCLALGWIPLVAIYLSGAQTPGASLEKGVAAWEWWLTQTKVVCLYLKLTVWPWPLVIHYHIPYLRSVVAAWPWLLATGLLGIGTMVFVWRKSALGFVGTWFFAVLSPTLLIVLVGETAVERRMYVPLAALVPLILVSGYAVLQQVWPTAASTERNAITSSPLALFSLLGLALAIAFGYLDSQRLLAYRDEISIWQDAVVHQPLDPLLRVNLATNLVKQGQVKTAIEHLETALKLDPDFYQAHYNLARAFEDSGRAAEAIQHYRATIRLRPQDAASHHNLAGLLQDAGDTRAAIVHYRKAIEAKQDFSAAHTNLAILLFSSGFVESSIQHFETALRLQPDLPNYMNLVMAYTQTNRIEAAIPLAEKALQLARAQGETQLAKELETSLPYLRAQSK